MDPIVVQGMPGPTGIYDPSVTGDLFFFSYSGLAGAFPTLPFIDSIGVAKRVHGAWFWGGGVNLGRELADGRLWKYEVADAVMTPSGVVLASHFLPWKDPEDGWSIERQGQTYVMGGNLASQGMISMKINRTGAWGEEFYLETRDLKQLDPDLRDVQAFTEPGLWEEDGKLYMALTAHGLNVRIVLLRCDDLQRPVSDWDWFYQGVLLAEPDEDRAGSLVDHWTAASFAKPDGHLQMAFTPVIMGAYSGAFIADVENLEATEMGPVRQWVGGNPDLTTPTGMLTHDGANWLFAQTDWEREHFLNVWPVD
jgi:hypothetical protein